MVLLKLFCIPESLETSIQPFYNRKNGPTLQQLPGNSQYFVPKNTRVQSPTGGYGTPDAPVIHSNHDYAMHSG